MDITNILLIIFIGFTSCNYSYAQSYDNITSLKTVLFSGYDSTIIPLKNQSSMMSINFFISVTAMPQVDTIDSRVQLTMSINVTWKDEKLTWEPSYYDNIQTMIQPTDSIWIPSFVLGSGQSYEYVNTPRNVVIHHTGIISMVTKQSFVTLCDFKMAHWPFDKHQCVFNFIQVDTEPGKIRLTADGTNIQSDAFQQLGPWVYEDCTTEIDRNSNRNTEAIFYNLTFHRQAAFYILTIIFPLICITFLSLLVFMLPCDSGERINFSITIMLSMTVFLTIMKDEVPKTSHPLPIMCIFVSALILAVFLNTIANACCLIIYHRSDTIPVNQSFLFLATLVNRNKGGGKVTVGEEPSCYDNNKTLIGVKPVQGIQSDQDDQSDIQNEKSKEGIGSEPYPESKITWREVTQAMDKIMFVMLLMILIIASFVAFICLMTD